jgi:hypothetical protein
VNRIAACGLSLLLCAPLHAIAAQGADLGGGVAGSSCGGGMDLVRTGATTDFKPMLVSVNGSAAKPEGTERRSASRAAIQQAQWIRRTDTAVAEPGTGVLLVAGLLGVWAVARRRNLSS